MTEIRITDAAFNYLSKKGVADSKLILIADDGGGKYSLQGGSCSIGDRFSLIKVAAADPDYLVELTNNKGLALYTSDYDLALMDAGLVLDFQNGGLALKCDAGLLDSGVQIGDGDKLLAANKHVEMDGNKNCSI